jgi:hypothetical protein
LFSSGSWEKNKRYAEQAAALVAIACLGLDEGENSAKTTAVNTTAINTTADIANSINTVATNINTIADNTTAANTITSNTTSDITTSSNSTADIAAYTSATAAAFTTASNTTADFNIADNANAVDTIATNTTADSTVASTTVNTTAAHTTAVDNVMNSGTSANGITGDAINMSIADDNSANGTATGVPLDKNQPVMHNGDVIGSTIVLINNNSTDGNCSALDSSEPIKSSKSLRDEGPQDKAPDATEENLNSCDLSSAPS